MESLAYGEVVPTPTLPCTSKPSVGAVFVVAYIEPIATPPDTLNLDAPAVPPVPTATLPVEFCMWILLVLLVMIARSCAVGIPIAEATAFAGRNTRFAVPSLIDTTLVLVVPLIATAPVLLML